MENGGDSMRYITKKHIPLRLRFSRGGKKPKKVFAFFSLCLFSLWTFLSEAGLSRVSPQLTEEAVRDHILFSIQNAVHEELEGRENSFVSTEREAGGQIASVTTDTSALNLLKTGILAKLEQDLNGRVCVNVPIGSLTGIGILNGRGFPVPLKLQLEGSADISFQTEFVSAGVNQSCHRITMTVNGRAYSQSNRFEAFVEASTATVLAETVVVGAVPDVALSEL